MLRRKEEELGRSLVSFPTAGSQLSLSCEPRLGDKTYLHVTWRTRSFSRCSILHALINSFMAQVGLLLAITRFSSCWLLTPFLWMLETWVCVCSRWSVFLAHGAHTVWQVDSLAQFLLVSCRVNWKHTSYVYDHGCPLHALICWGVCLDAHLHAKCKKTTSRIDLTYVVFVCSVGLWIAITFTALHGSLCGVGLPCCASSYNSQVNIPVTYSSCICDLPIFVPCFPWIV